MKFYLPIVCGLVFDFVGAQQAPAVPWRETIRTVYTGVALVNPAMGRTMHFYSNVPANYGSQIALPLGGHDRQRRYRLGTVTLVAQ